MSPCPLLLVFQKCLELKYQIWLVVFSFSLQLQTSHFTRLHGFRSCRPGLPEKKKQKIFIWCNGKETTTMCATFCSLERSSATKHFDWTLLSNPALQTVPFFLSKTKHKGITPKIARISGCSIKGAPLEHSTETGLFHFLVRIVLKQKKKKTYHKCMEYTRLMPYWKNRLKLL